ncbi:hypothetical protein JCGZ_06758 [Jatropha curcas]|uniref:Uncharacterized protein n=1 Tax=Jatropha curcas TaxID=180498 RepID=A0A067KZP3_JATCU|nr:uncharacterized protein LOC105634692 [Jatropha curcas]KDP37304.1 hypothetical protein JCGZ_06758 [Jatropha curcas]
MPQVDLETLVSACAGVSCDRKIACETLATTTTASDNHNQQPQDSETDPPELPPDFPPESFWLSKDAEYDWFDRNAFIERKDSTKGNNSHSANLNPNIIPHSGIQSNSQRFSNLKSKASILGLPKPQKSCFVEARRYCKPGKTRLFPKRSASVSKSDSSLIEPSSPKVSCMGRVRSKKDRNRRLRNRQRSGRSSETDNKREKVERKQRTGFFSTFRAIFRVTKHNTRNRKDGSLSRQGSTAKTTITDIRDRLPAGERDSQPRKSVDSDGFEPAAGTEPVGLGAMKRFASGRKSDSWVDVA